MAEFRDYLNGTACGQRTARLYSKIVSGMVGNGADDIDTLNRIILKYPTARYAFIYYLRFKGREHEIKRLVIGKYKPAVYEGTYLSSDELYKVASSIDVTKFKVMAIIQFATGIRATDTLRIVREDVTLNDDMSLRIRTFGKGGNERIAFVSAAFSSVVWDYIKDYPMDSYPFLDGLIMRDAQAEEAAYHNYYLALKRAVKTLYPKMGTHDFRRNFINDVYKATKDLIKTQHIVGHSSPADTAKYIDKKVSEAEQKAISNSIR